MIFIQYNGERIRDILNNMIGEAEEQRPAWCHGRPKEGNRQDYILAIHPIYRLVRRNDWVIINPEKDDKGFAQAFRQFNYLQMVDVNGNPLINEQR